MTKKISLILLALALLLALAFWRYVRANDYLGSWEWG